MQRPPHGAELVLTAFLGVIVLGVAGAIIGLLLPSFPGRDELLATIAMLAAYTVAACVIGVAFRPRSRLVAWLCIVPLALSFVLFQALLWFDSALDWSAEENVAKLGGTCLILSAVLLYDGLVRLPALHTPSARVLRIGGTIVAALAGLALCSAIWIDFFQEDFTLKTFGVLTALAIGTLFAIYVLAGLAKLRQARAGDSALSALTVPVSLTCPRCSNANEVPSNRPARCAHCNLRLTVQIDEPRCACGYLLYQLESDTCPECGRDVPQHERWHAPSNKPSAKSEDTP